MASRRSELRAPLASQPFRVLMGAQLASQLGDWAARLALALLVFERTSSPALTSATVAVTLLPWVGIGQVLASTGDRFGRRRTMISADLGRAAIFALIASIDLPVGLLLALAFLAGCLDPPFEAARAATIPSVVSKDDYPDALAISSALDQTGLLVGYALGGTLVGIVGAQGALAVNAATFVLSASLLTRLPHDAGDRSAKLVRIGSAFRVIAADGVILHAVTSFCAIAFFAMAVEAQVAPFVSGVVGLSDAEVGLVAAMVTIGTLLGTLVLRVRGSDRRLLRLTGILGVTGGLGALLTLGFGTSAPVAYLTYFWIGVAFLASLPANAAAGRRIPDEIRTSTFAVLQAGVLGSQALGALVGGALAEIWDTRSTVVAASAAVALAGVGGLASMHRPRVVAALGQDADRAAERGTATSH